MQVREVYSSIPYLDPQLSPTHSWLDLDMLVEWGKAPTDMMGTCRVQVTLLADRSWVCKVSSLQSALTIYPTHGLTLASLFAHSTAAAATVAEATTRFNRYSRSITMCDLTTASPIVSDQQWLRWQVQAKWRCVVVLNRPIRSGPADIGIPTVG